MKKRPAKAHAKAHARRGCSCRSVLRNRLVAMRESPRVCTGSRTRWSKWLPGSVCALRQVAAILDQLARSGSEPRNHLAARLFVPSKCIGKPATTTCSSLKPRRSIAFPDVRVAVLSWAVGNQAKLWALRRGGLPTSASRSPGSRSRKN